MENLLKQLEIVWPELRWNDDNHLQKGQTLHPFVMEKYEAFIATGKFPYLASVQTFIESFLPALTEHQKENMYTQIYNAAQKHRANERLAMRAKMLNEGWLLLSDDLFKQAVEAKQNFELSGKKNCDLMSVSLSGIWKPVYDGDNRAFLVAPRKRSKGTYLNNLFDGGNTDVFCKLVKRK